MQMTTSDKNFSVGLKVAKKTTYLILMANLAEYCGNWILQPKMGFINKI